MSAQPCHAIVGAILFVNYIMSKYTNDILSEIGQTDSIIPPVCHSDMEYVE